MLKQNVGGLDRALRVVAGLALITVGLFALRGWQGNFIGIAVAAFALMPLVTGLTGFCPAYIPFGISTRSGSRRESHAPCCGADRPRSCIGAGAHQ